MRGLHKLERRRKAGFEFVQEGVFQKLAETQRLKVRRPRAQHVYGKRHHVPSSPGYAVRFQGQYTWFDEGEGGS